MIKMRISGRLPSMWVSHPSPTGPTYLLSRMANGSIRLLHADTEDAARVRLALQTKRKLQPYISADGRLYLIEFLGDPESLDFCEVCWHTIDASTGQTLASERKLRWHPAFLENSPYQAQAQRVLALADEHSIAVLDAGSLQEISRIVVTPRSLKVDHEDMRIVQTISWCPGGEWVSAILLIASERESPSAPFAVSSEVHIYDAASGACVQAVQFQAPVQLSWSPCLALAAVQGENVLYECLAKIGYTATAAGRPAPLKGPVKILDPAQDVVIEGTSQMLAQCPQDERWMTSWSPAGALLIAQHGSKCVVLDGLTGQAVFESEWAGFSFEGSTWASTAEAVFLPAALPTQQAWIKFVRNDGNWRHAAKTFQIAPELRGLGGARISPDGRMVAGWAKLGGTCRARIYHHNLETGQGQVTIRDCVAHGGPKGFASNFAGWPSAWPQVNAHIHASSFHQEEYAHGRTKGFPAWLKVMEGQAHKVLGSWTAADLLDLIPGTPTCTAAICDEVSDGVWAPKGNHLAVFCNNNTWILVLTFREPA